MKNTSLFAATVLTLFVAAAAHSQPAMRDGALADAAGRSVYTFDKDEASKSNCTGGCLVAWPAFVAKAEATPKGEFGIMEANGVRQWTVNGKPLYYFAGDAKPGDRNGDGKGGTWHLVTSKPTAQAPQATPAATGYKSVY
jgi:predicted lipoprotein with Yx(FWY)xxD motif